MTPTGGKYCDRFKPEPTRDNYYTTGNVSAMVAGCTANVILITATKIYCANAGDSRCIVRENQQVIPLSIDHKPSDEGETARIRATGHLVIRGRVDAQLSVSRAIGDWEYKDCGE